MYSARFSKVAVRVVRDGLEVLREQLDLAQIMKLIEGTAMWVDRETFRYLPVWYPDQARGDLMYKANWSEPLHNTNKSTGHKVHKQVGNTSASKTLTMALGLRLKDRPNWTCCHIWGIDDDTYQIPNTIVTDKRYFSCVANMVLLPTPLKAFTDVMMEVKAMLRISAAYYYDWVPEDINLVSLAELEKMCDWDAYPSSWPRKGDPKELMGVVKLNDTIKRYADKRKAAIFESHNDAGQYYPRDEVNGVLKYWKVSE